jgi:hypothetical protein
MRDVLVAVFWIWLLVALGVYAYRIYRRITGGPRREREQSGVEPSAAVPSPPPAAPAPPPVTTDPVAPTAPPTTPVSPPPEPPAPAPTTGTPPPTAAPGAPAVAPGRAAGPGEAEDDDGRRGLFASQGPRPPGGVGDRPAPGRATVAEAVTGIALPCELAPLVGGEARLDPYRVVFSTHRADAATVGAGLGDELERLGYTVRSTSDHEAVAVRDEVSLTVSILPATDDFPTAPPGSVVVVLAT